MNDVVVKCFDVSNEVPPVLAVEQEASDNREPCPI